VTFRGLGVLKGDIGCLEDFLLDLDLVERFLSGVVGFSASMSCDQFSVTGGLVMKVVRVVCSPSHSLYCRLSLPLLKGVNICTPVFHLAGIDQSYNLSTSPQETHIDYRPVSCSRSCTRNHQSDQESLGCKYTSVGCNICFRSSRRIDKNPSSRL
jgi:hypothetical protein